MTSKKRLTVCTALAVLFVCIGIGLVIYCYNWNHNIYNMMLQSEFRIEHFLLKDGVIMSEVEHGFEGGYYDAALIGTPICVIIAVAAILYGMKAEKFHYFFRKAKETVAEHTSASNKPFEEMTPSEQARHLRFLEQMYNHGDLSFIEYNTLKAKYTGEKSFVEQYGIEFTMAASDKLAADKAMQQHIENAQKRIITNAAVGNAVGGLAGGIAFSVSAANKANAEAAQLHAQQEKANKRYEEALKDSVK